MELQTYQLRDIHGLDAIPWWPPAPGWWLLAIGLILGLWLFWRLLPYLRIPGVVGITWRWDAAHQLRDLRRRVGRQDTKRSAGELSELLRRIAMARRGRDVCAGLSGQRWLDWLRDHDPQGFDWSNSGTLMLDLPYAPPGRTEADDRRILELIDATHGWVAREHRKQGSDADV